MKLHVIASVLIFVVAHASGLFLPEALSLEQDVVVSAYQGSCSDGDFTANVATAKRVIVQARARGSHFLVFPENFLSGGDTLKNLQRGTRRLDDPDLRAFIEGTADHELVIVVGLARLTDEGPFTSALVIQGGRLVGVYDKLPAPTWS